MAEFWVFGYGSLIWRPDFPFQERRTARLMGAHRALCVYSWVHRGTRERPGLVLGLDRGGVCRGVAYRVAAADGDAVLANLRAREQVTSVYLEQVREALFDDGERRPVLAYVVDRAHPQYAGRLDEAAEFAIVAGAEGVSGRNRDYVLNTAAHLAGLAMPDRRLQRLAARLRGEASG